MIRLLRSDGCHQEVKEAVSAAIEGEDLVCLDEQGTIVARFDRLTVTAYGQHEALQGELPPSILVADGAESEAGGLAKQSEDEGVR
ncbi:MAG: hypothetical protein GEU75_17535 [Dehalococcoidia bacterium]|nr:hypothetical protein [Dehalococcoidia bacterium]